MKMKGCKQASNKASIRQKMNVLNRIYQYLDDLIFTLSWGWAMFLRCSYFLANLRLNVLINMVLTQIKECKQVSYANNFLTNCMLESPGRSSFKELSIFLKSWATRTFLLYSFRCRTQIKPTYVYAFMFFLFLFLFFFYFNFFFFFFSSKLKRC